MVEALPSTLKVLCSSSYKAKIMVKNIKSFIIKENNCFPNKKLLEFFLLRSAERPLIGIFSLFLTYKIIIIFLFILKKTSHYLNLCKYIFNGWLYCIFYYQQVPLKIYFFN